MCGITGNWTFAGRDLSEREFRAFNDSLAHRGPDGFGTEHFAADGLWLGHRRLAIIDLSERGRQPMSYAEGRYWLTYNGEVYNYLELRETLRGLGHRFVSETDSEVILAAYAEWGPQCQLRFNGMWALAIWDAQAKRLFLSRDRFGIKPLHYAAHKSSFAFASELKAFLQLPWCDGALDEAMVSETLGNINGEEITPYTLLPGVSRLPGGHCLTVEQGGRHTVSKWWDTLAHVPTPPQSLRKQTQEFREIFLDACRLRLRSDVSIATALSGGLDSSAVACSLADLGRRGAVDHVPQDWHQAFVACFPGTRLDERRYAEQVVEHTGMRPHYHDVDDTLALRHIEKVVFDLEAIYWMPLVGPWSIYREMRNGGIRVSMDGHGADELLGGYHFFLERCLDALIGPNFRLRRYLDLRKTLLGLRGGSAYISRGSVASEIRAGVIAKLQQYGLADTARRVLDFYDRKLLPLWRLLRPPPAPAGGATPGPSLPPLEPAMRPWTGERKLYDEASDPRTRGMSTLDSMLFCWFHANILPTILRSYDRSSMAHGIEVRMPFMDWRLVTFAFGLPEESKIGNGFTKLILREAMKGLMPDPIRLRTNKIGFTTPLDEWARTGLRSWFLDTVASRRFLDSPIWNGPAARAAVERSLEGHCSMDPIWPVIHAHILGETFRANAQRAAQADVQPLATGAL